MTRRGLILIDRGLMSHTSFQDEPYTEREVWIWMIMEASYEARSLRILNKIIDLERGQFAASLRFMAERFKWKKDRVARFIKRLAKEGMIETSVATGETVISICNYEVYQDFELYSETGVRQQCDSNATPTRQGRDKLELNTNKIQTKDIKRRGKRLEEDWRPSASDCDYARGHNWSDEEIEREAENFVEHFTNGNGRRQTSPDWSKRWQRWVRTNYSGCGKNPTAKRRKGFAAAHAEMEIQRGGTPTSNSGTTGMFAGVMERYTQTGVYRGGDGDA